MRNSAFKIFTLSLIWKNLLLLTISNIRLNFVNLDIRFLPFLLKFTNKQIQTFKHKKTRSEPSGLNFSRVEKITAINHYKHTTTIC